MNIRRLSTAGIAGASANHPWRTIGVWAAAIVIAIGLMAALLGDALTTKTTLTNNPESVRADNLIEERLGSGEQTIGEMAIVRSETLTVDDPAFRAKVDALHGELIALGPDLVASGATYYSSGDETLVSADRRTTLLPLTLPEGVGDAQVELIHQVIERAGTDGGFTVLITGQASLDAELNAVAERDLAIGEGIGITAALIILTLVIGAVVAATLPILLAIAAIIVSFGVTALVGQVVELPFFVINMMTMMGLAVGIDYALFIVSRYREERAAGQAKIAAITTSGATAGRTVLISGMTVGLALIGLLISPDSGNRSIGAAALLVVGAAVFGSITLLPAMLSLLGDRIDAGRIPIGRRRAARANADGHGFWGWAAGAVMRRPVLSLIAATGLLLAAASSYLDIERGDIGVSALPDGMMSKEAYILLEREFGFGQDLPAVIVIDGAADDPAVAAAIERLDAAIAADPAFASTTLESRPEANLAILRAWLTGDPATPSAMAAIERLRGELIPAAMAGSPARALVTGDTANMVDVAKVNADYTPIVFAFILGCSFLLLMVAFRSIVVPIKAILLNLLSVGAAYGLLVLVFQKGVGAGLFGFTQVEVIQTELPLFLFAVLFGLSMDYHVFLLSRIRERFLETGDNAEAVAYGLRSTGRLITGAALIMVAVFGGFALGDLVAMQQFGFGLAVAVLIDATIIRTILVPASMRLLGEWNWYLPNFLNWLPNLSIDAPAPTEQPAWGD